MLSTDPENVVWTWIPEKVFLHLQFIDCYYHSLDILSFTWSRIQWEAWWVANWKVWLEFSGSWKAWQWLKRSRHDVMLCGINGRDIYRFVCDVGSSPTSKLVNKIGMLEVSYLVTMWAVYMTSCLIYLLEHSKDAGTSSRLGCHETLYVRDILAPNSHRKSFPGCKVSILYANLMGSIEYLQFELIDDMGLPLK